MNGWMSRYSCHLLQITLTTRAATYRKNNPWLTKKTPATDPHLLNMPPTTRCLFPWPTSPALHFQCMPTVQSHCGNIVEWGAVSTGKCLRVKQWKESCRTETEAIRFFRTPGTSYHMIRRHIPHDFTVQRQAAFSVQYYFIATQD